MSRPAQETIDAILATLKRRGRRLTPQRALILETVVASEGHLDVEQIRERVNAGGGSVSFATTYRTMRMLVDEGLIKERHFEDGAARYEYVSEGEHHDHLVCTKCGRVAEFTNDTIEDLQVEIAAAHGYTLTAHRHELYGLCGDCR